MIPGAPPLRSIANTPCSLAAWRSLATFLREVMWCVRMSACHGASLEGDGDEPLEDEDNIDERLMNVTPVVTREAAGLEQGMMRIIQILFSTGQLRFGAAMLLDVVTRNLKLP
jgi:hypothetical protein